MVITDIAPLVQAQVKMCPMPMIFAEIRWAATKYLEDSRAWTATIRNSKMIADAQIQDIPSIYGAKVANIYDVRLVALNDTGAVSGRSEMVCVQGDGNFDYDHRMYMSSGLPRYWRFENEALRIWPAPTEDVAEHSLLDIDVSLTIDGKNPVIPDWSDMDVIAYGALGKLYALASQDWFNVELANWYSDKFAKGIAELRIKRIHGGKPGSTTLNAPAFGGYF